MASTQLTTTITIIPGCLGGHSEVQGRRWSKGLLSPFQPQHLHPHLAVAAPLQRFDLGVQRASPERLSEVPGQGEAVGIPFP